MSAQVQTDLQQLTETVARLSEALAASERRQAAVARSVRWGALSLIVLVGAVAYAASDWLKAYADQVKNPWVAAEQQIAAQPPTLDQVLMSLMSSKEMQGAIVKVLQSAAMIGSQETVSYLQCEQERSQLPPAQQQKKLCFSKAAVEDLGMYFLDDDGKLPTPPGPSSSQQEQMAYATRLMEGTIMAAGQAVVDGAALVHRVRRDSDLLRKTVDDVGGVQEKLISIQRELHLMNAALLSVPAMANEMNVMNRQMSVMSYGVGSTMGRMGSMMPW
jgi:hypothetical protein